MTRSRRTCSRFDFQIFKGSSEISMTLWDSSVTTAQEAHLLIRDDQRIEANRNAFYAIFSMRQSVFIKILRPVEPLIAIDSIEPLAA